MSDATALHTKYRPRTLEEVVGHEKVVKTLNGIVSTNKWPSAIAFFGPTSAGKTTLAHALVSSALGAPAHGHPDFTEINASDSKSIDDVRSLIQISQLRPAKGKRRFILIDEAQGLLSNAQAAAAILKPLESPPKTTTWILGSMDPVKFQTTENGRAMANRCTQFVLEPPSDEALDKQARRILKGEGITFIDKEGRTKIVESCNQQMRSLANLIQAAQSYHSGLGKEAPDVLSQEDITEVLARSQPDDAVAAVRFLTAIYARKFAAAHKEILDMQDGFSVVHNLMNLNWFVLNHTVLKGAKHPSVRGWPAAFRLKEQLEKVMPNNRTLSIEAYGYMQAELTKLKAQAQAFAVPEPMLLSQFAFNAIQALKPILEEKE